MIIVLLGYMASGKTTIAKKLSEKIGFPVIDLDTYLEKKEQKSISAIFSEDGEVYFRLKEHEYLQEILKNKDNCILSLGGGTPCYANNMELILSSNKCVAIYLKGSISTLVYRIQQAKQNRPLVCDKNEEQLTEFVAKHLFERSYFYEMANKKVIIDDKTIDELVTELCNSYYLYLDKND